jgi:hypothetical protein
MLRPHSFSFLRPTTLCPTTSLTLLLLLLRLLLSLLLQLQLLLGIVAVISARCHETVLSAAQPVHVISAKVACVHCVVVVVVNGFARVSKTKCV